MSIFGSQNKQSKEEKSDDQNFVFPVQSGTSLNHTLISEDLEIKGNIVGKDYIELSGKIIGSVKSKKIDIRPKGFVSGEITTDTLSVEGEIDGEINVGDLYIRSSSKIRGTIKYKNIDIQSGAIISAELIKTI